MTLTLPLTLDHTCLSVLVGEFLDANEEQLKGMPPPPVAVDYYRAADLYMFDKFQTSQVRLRSPGPQGGTVSAVSFFLLVFSLLLFLCSWAWAHPPQGRGRRGAYW